MERPDGRTGWERFSPFAKHGSLSHQTLYQGGKQQRAGTLGFINAIIVRAEGIFVYISLLLQDCMCAFHYCRKAVSQLSLSSCLRSVQAGVSGPRGN